MKKLNELVEILENNMKCVVLKIKDNARMELICLGCFTGNEDMIRVTKGNNHTITIFSKNGSESSWSWGSNECTLAFSERNNITDLVIDCIVDYFAIFITGTENIPTTCHIQKIEDTHNIPRNIEMMWWEGRLTSICVHQNGYYYKHFSSKENVYNHFNGLGYTIISEPVNSVSPQTGCLIEAVSFMRKGA